MSDSLQNTGQILHKNPPFPVGFPFRCEGGTLHGQAEGIIPSAGPVGSSTHPNTSPAHPPPGHRGRSLGKQPFHGLIGAIYRKEKAA